MSDFDKYLSEIEERCKVASPGPWVANHGNFNLYKRTKRRKFSYVQNPNGFVLERGVTHNADGLQFLAIKEDAELIAHSRTDIETLVKMVRVAVKGLIAINNHALDREDDEGEKALAELDRLAEEGK